MKKLSLENIMVLADTILGHSDAELGPVMDCLDLEVATFSENSFLVLEGQPLTKIGIVLAGKVSLTKVTAEGNRIILTVLGEGKVFGALTTFSQRESWPCSVEAHRNCKIAFIPQTKILSLYEEKCPDYDLLLKNILQAMSEEALMLFNKIEILSLKSPREKIISYLREEYNKEKSTVLKLSLNREELADFLNMSRPSLSRELGRMRDEGLIKFHKSTITILDPDKVVL